MFFNTHKIDRRYMQLIDTIDINTCILFRVCSRYLVVCRYYTSGGTDYCGCCCCCCCYCCCCCCCCYCPYCYCCVPLPSLGGTICCTRHYCCFVVVAVGFASGPGGMSVMRRNYPTTFFLHACLLQQIHIFWESKYTQDPKIRFLTYYFLFFFTV